MPGQGGKRPGQSLDSFLFLGIKLSASAPMASRASCYLPSETTHGLGLFVSSLISLAGSGAASRCPEGQTDDMRKRGRPGV